MAGGSWEAHNLPSIWNMIQDENACTGADRVLSWDSLSQDVRDQHSRLLKAKEELAAVWPPEHNGSAQVYLRYMEGLAASMQQTLTRAEDTRAGLRGIIEAIGAAQMKIRPLVELRKEASDDLIPRWADKAEDEYDDKARQAMREAEAAIADHSTQIQPPSLFQLRGGWQPEEPTPGDGGSTTFAGSGGAAGGVGAGASGGSDLGTLKATPVPVEVPHPSPPSSPGSEIPAGTEPDLPIGGPSNEGPDLAGVIPLNPNTGVGPGASAGAALPGGSAPPGGVIGGGGLLGLAPGVSPSIGGGAVGGVTGPLGGRGVPPGRQPVSMRTAMPSGAVIGGNGVPGRGMPGVLGSPARPGGTSAARPGTTGGRGQSVLQPGATNRGRGGDADSHVAEGVADQSWDVLEGVAPVIEPDTRPVHHSPGPGVIGLSR